MRVSINKREYYRKYFKSALLLSLIVVIVFIYLCYSFFKEDVTVDSDQIVIVKADHSPYKIKPKINKGIKVANIDKTIYEVYAKIKSKKKILANSKYVNILPTPEQPLSINLKSLEEDNSVENIIDNLLNKRPYILGDKNKNDTNIDDAILNSNCTQDPKLSPNQILEIIKLDQADERLQAVSLKLESKHQKYRLYLGSAYNIYNSEQLWNQLFQDNKKIMEGLKHSIQSVIVENDKLIYDVLAGDFYDFHSAQILCKRLIMNQQNCLVVKY